MEALFLKEWLTETRANLGKPSIQGERGQNNHRFYPTQKPGDSNQGRTQPYSKKPSKRSRGLTGHDRRRGSGNNLFIFCSYLEPNSFKRESSQLTPQLSQGTNQEGLKIEINRLLLKRRKEGIRTSRLLLGGNRTNIQKLIPNEG